MIWRQWWGKDPPAFTALRTEILRRATTIASHTSHNKGGWRSQDDLLNWPLDEVKLLADHVAKAVAGVHEAEDGKPRDFTYKAWAIVNRAGSFHSRHVHGPGAVWSAIYYLDPGGEVGASTIFEVQPINVRIAPERGMLVIFPPDTWHSVEPHQGTEPRITIAFDVI
jgi:hypothetical protein